MRAPHASPLCLAQDLDVQLVQQVSAELYPITTSVTTLDGEIEAVRRAAKSVGESEAFLKVGVPESVPSGNKAFWPVSGT